MNISSPNTEKLPYMSEASYRKLSTSVLEKCYPAFYRFASTLADGFALHRSSDGETFKLTLGKALVGFVSVLTYLSDDRYVHEIEIYVAPEFRHHRIGSKLCSALIETTGADYPDSDFYLVGNCDGFAEYVGAHYSFSDYFMIKPALNTLVSDSTGNQSYGDDTSVDLIGDSDNSSVNFVSGNGNDHTVRMYVFGVSVARLHVNIYPHQIAVSKVYTNKAHRNKGYAGMLVDHVAATHPDHSLVLHVEAKNKPAVACYTKAGFQITESIDYYLVDF